MKKVLIICVIFSYSFSFAQKEKYRLVNDFFKDTRYIPPIPLVLENKTDTTFYALKLMNSKLDSLLKEIEDKPANPNN